MSTEESEQSLFVDVFLFAIALFVLGLMLLFVDLCWEGFSTDAKIQDAKEQAFEHTIKLNGCKLTGYYKRSNDRMFICDDGQTYKEDVINMQLVGVE